MQTTIGEVRKPYDCPSDIICLVLKALKLKKSQFFENKKRGATPPFMLITGYFEENNIKFLVTTINMAMTYYGGSIFVSNNDF